MIGIVGERPLEGAFRRRLSAPHEFDTPHVEVGKRVAAVTLRSRGLLEPRDRLVGLGQLRPLREQRRAQGQGQHENEAVGQRGTLHSPWAMPRFSKYFW